MENVKQMEHSQIERLELVPLSTSAGDGQPDAMIPSTGKVVELKYSCGYSHPVPLFTARGGNFSAIMRRYIASILVVEKRYKNRSIWYVLDTRGSRLKAFRRAIIAVRQAELDKNNRRFPKRIRDIISPSKTDLNINATTLRKYAKSFTNIAEVSKYLRTI